MTLLKILIFLLFICGTLDRSVANRNPKYKAAQQVLSIIRNPQRYDKDVVPYRNSSEPVIATVTMYIRSLDIDDINMRTNVDLTFRMTWKDERLSYSVPVPSVRFSDATKFWIPDAFFRNSFDTELTQTVYPETFLEVSSEGDVLYSSRFLLNLRCSMNLKAFPHEQQQCPLIVASYGYSTEDVVLLFKEDGPFTFGRNMVISNRFDLETVTSDYCTSKTSTGDYSCLRLLFKINRIFNGYLLEWYLPCMSLVITAFLAELLDASEILPRLLITVGPLLTLIAVNLNYHNTIPSVPYTTAIDVFSGISLLAIFIIVLHVLLSFYFRSKPAIEEKIDEEGEPSKLKSVYGTIKSKLDYVIKIVIIALYVVFVIVYFICYNV